MMVPSMSMEGEVYVSREKRVEVPSSEENETISSAGEITSCEGDEVVAPSCEKEEVSRNIGENKVLSSEVKKEMVGEEDSSEVEGKAAHSIEEKEAFSSETVKMVIPFDPEENNKLVTSDTAEEFSVVTSDTAEEDSVVTSDAAEEDSVVTSDSAEEDSVVTSDTAEEDSVVTSDTAEEDSVVTSDTAEEDPVVTSDNTEEGSVATSSLVKEDIVVNPSPHKEEIRGVASRQMKEVLAVSLLLSIFLLWSPAAVLITFYLLFTDFWWAPLFYWVWWLYDVPVGWSGGRRGALVTWARHHCVWKHFRNYFPVNLIKTADLDPSEKHIIGSHPHGLLPFGSLAAFGTEAASFSSKFPGISPHLTSLGGNFLRPLFREAFLCFGAVSCSRKSLDFLLSSDEAGQVPVIMVGGVPEVNQSHEKAVKLYLHNRKGFVKLALKHGANLVPAFSFGETSVYRQNEGINMFFQTWVKRFIGIAPVIFCGRGFLQTSFGILPQRKTINVVVGAPIKVEKVVYPTLSQIDELHQKYMEALQRLYDSHNKEFGDETIKLEIE